MSKSAFDKQIQHTVIFQQIVDKYGIESAVVYGHLWLYTDQGAKGCCYCNTTIQRDLHASLATVKRIVATLKQEQLIYIITKPNRRDREIFLNNSHVLSPYVYKTDIAQIEPTMAQNEPTTRVKMSQPLAQIEPLKHINKQNINIEGEATLSPLPPLSSFVDSVKHFQSDKHERTEWDAQKAAEFIRDNCIAKKQQIATQEELDAKIAIAVRSWKGLYTFMTPQAVRTRTAPKKKDAFASLDQRISAAREMARRRKEKEACANAVEVTILENNHD